MRRFNRFYTKQIGVLHEGLLNSPFSLTEGRVLYELAHHEKAVATALSSELNLDLGYLSRILRAFRNRGLIAKETSMVDGRQNLLSLTRKGQEAFRNLDAHAREEMRAMLSGLQPRAQSRLIEAMEIIQELLGARPDRRSPFLLRPHQPGDMGWVVNRHGVLYAQEYGWDEQFEAIVASIVAKFIQNYDAKRERCWIAEKDGEPVGSVFLVSKSKRVAQLRLLLVEPRARGLGIGEQLVFECLRFARQVGYRRMTLWTNAGLDAARHIYEKMGFRLVDETKHHSFGHDLIGQIWELTL
ncbi:MAG TPA: helix-turn-helix domain-containing GNAT family N-acetyltransferase [Vicinamibacteria bacterium]|nr:helix-turn-helix domain-containing GNAT family N-acetyltransferase [Vicinamibacteria bacterium]